jgi:superfamily II DNA or RNA helicase
LKKFISDYIDFYKATKTKFNIVASGCGTGKTYWVANTVTESLPHIKPAEMIFVTSRSLIVEQQSKEDGITKFNPRNVISIKCWSGEEDSLEVIAAKGIQIMTYDKIINILKTQNTEGFETLSKVKLFSLMNVILFFLMVLLKIWNH